MPTFSATLLLRSLLLALALGGVATSSGCRFLPEIAHEPVIHNPFPQLSKVAVAPFFNLSAEPTVDGRQFALAYFNALQSIPGFEVLPVGVVERKMVQHKLSLGSPDDARKLAQLLGVDAVVVGAVTDFTAYYPPRCGLQVEWYAANPCFHEIPPGYGLPWGTPEEEQIPAPLIFEAEMALARAQLATQTPYAPLEVWPESDASMHQPAPNHLPGGDLDEKTLLNEGQEVVHHEPHAPGAMDATVAPDVATLPEGWPNPLGFIPPPPSPVRPPCEPSGEPVLVHTAIYNGQDGEFTEALASYYFFEDDARFGGWQSYLQRSDDFIRFCCYLHISEMLSARGGAGETRVVWRWPASR